MLMLVIKPLIPCFSIRFTRNNLNSFGARLQIVNLGTALPDPQQFRFTAVMRGLIADNRIYLALNAITFKSMQSVHVPTGQELIDAY